MADEPERTEAPTGRRLEEARRKGQIARSPEVGTAFTILGAAGFLTWAGTGWSRALTELLPALLTRVQVGEWHPGAIHDYSIEVFALFLNLVLPPVLLLAVVGIGANVLQVGFLFTTRTLEPNWGKLNPFQGLKRLFARHMLAELLKGPLKLATIGGIAFITLRPRVAELVTLAGRDPSAAVATVTEVTLTLLWRIGAAYLVLALLDYGYQRWTHLRSLRMTREEVKEEMRQSEGDPHIRARARHLHRQYAMRRMMSEVPKADVVVTNPTHLAVALRYDRETMRAPKVVAKGARLIAEEIKKRARTAGVPIVEHPPLAQALYKSVELGGEIPASLYRAVAEVLAYVYMLSQRQHPRPVA
ncbi:MAG: flagellar biosynthesis protein FlhB [Candidatus Rokubacteria bacterium]|nr:flagellar biosynthesis protein FlhB [Candidatus Rokubacteria bacterium]